MKLFRLQSRGQVLVLVALLMVALIAVAALAIDIGRAYGVKTKLNAAVDAASYEAARALAQGSGEAGMRRKAQDVASRYFRANFPEEFLGAVPPVPNVTASRDGNSGQWQVSVSATAQMPTMFAGVIGWRSFGITAASEAVRATLDMVLVLDASSSMSVADEKEGVVAFTLVKERAKEFVTLFDELDDRMGLVAFSTGAYPIVSICGQYPNDTQNPAKGTLSCNRGYEQDRLKGAIDRLYMGSMTASEEALKKALDQLRAVRPSHQSGRRVIVFFSDGAPNTFNGRFSLRGGGTASGNLYSGVFAGQRAEQLYDPGSYAQSEAQARIVDIAALPATDAEETVPTTGYHKKRRLTGNTSDTYLKCDANVVARDMTENVADMARKDDIVIYTIGYGKIDERQMFDPSCSTYNETGSTILKRLANTTDSDTYDSKQPSGIYCKAPDTEALKACFEQVASAILRITK